MYRFITAIVCMSIAIIGCKSNEQPKVEAQVVPSKMEEPFDYRNTSFESNYDQSEEFVFSSLNAKDIFTISIPQGKISQTISTLVIRSHEGKLILTESFPTEALIATYAASEFTDEQDIVDHIIENINGNLNTNRFDNEQFVNLLSKTPEADFLDYKVYKENLKNKLPIYDFKLGNEGHSFFGYSTSEEAAVQLFDCC